MQTPTLCFHTMTPSLDLFETGLPTNARFLAVPDRMTLKPHDWRLAMSCSGWTSVPDGHSHLTLVVPGKMGLMGKVCIHHQCDARSWNFPVQNAGCLTVKS